jgi:hypothetical protein
MRDDSLYYDTTSFYYPQFDQSTQYYQYYYTQPKSKKETPIKPVYTETTMMPSKENITNILANTLNKQSLKRKCLIEMK